MELNLGVLVPAITVVLTLGAGARAGAQPPEGGPDPAKVRVRIGPLWMNPTVALANLGIDDNVFNNSEDLAPKSDFTFTVVPNTDLWMRMGRTWISGSVREELVWYQTYSTERAANTGYKGDWKVPLNRLAIDVGGSYATVRDRPSYEIDARSQRTETNFNGLVEVRAMSRTFLGVRADRQRIDFDKDAAYLGANLQSELNHVTTGGGLVVRHQLTPLTSLSVNVSRSEDRFEFSSLRDSDSNTVALNITLDPLALIKGSATFGYRDFHPHSTALKDYKGFTSLVDLSYTVFGTTRFSVRAMRDIQYSYDASQPYYLQSGIDGSVAQQIFGPFDVVGRVGVQTLGYRDLAAAVVSVANRVDSVQTFGGGVGYRMGRDLRLGFNIDHNQRVSDLAGRRYTGLRFGTSVTYGL